MPAWRVVVTYRRDEPCWRSPMRRPPHPSRRRIAALVVSVALVLAACGGGKSTSADDAPAEAGEPQRGGSVTYGLEAETGDGWCLQEAQLAISGTMVARSIYDTLTAPNADGEYVPYLAESVEPDQDYKEWTITLRDGVTFHDGSPLTAEVVKNNLDAYRGQYPAREPTPLHLRARQHRHRRGHGRPRGHRHHQGALGRVPRLPALQRPPRHHRPGPAGRPRPLRQGPDRHRSVPAGELGEGP